MLVSRKILVIVDAVSDFGKVERVFLVEVI